MWPRWVSVDMLKSELALPWLISCCGFVYFGRHFVQKIEIDKQKHMQAMDTKKISFGFSKVAKKPNILHSKVAKEENRVELIKCVEGKEIKLVAERTEAAPLVIQMQGSQKTSSALASLMKRRQVLLGEDEPDPDESTSAPQSIAEVTAAISAENLEQRAARELLADAQANGSENLNGEKLVLPAVKADELPLEGAKEASLDDYESIPIQQFGLAMLRGMGWVEPPPKKKGSGPVDEAPFLRPKGMGLGADKALKPKALLVQPEKNEVLEIKKQAFVRILGGKQKDQYGQIEGFDDHAGRVIVKMAIGGNKEAFNEFLCQPVSRKEYSQYGKCINSAKYNEFKKQENEHGQIIVKQEKPSEGRSRDRREESKSYRNEDRDRKSYKGEGDQRSFKDEDRRSYKDEDRKSWKSESRNDRNDRSEKVESKPIKGDDRRHHKLDDHGDRKKYIQDPRSSSSSAHRTSTMQHQREERERRRSTSPRSSRRQKSSSDEADDTGESTESDSDSAYERKKPKKKATKKSKKHSKKSKSKSSRANDSSAESDDSLDEHRRHPTKHKKKTKKSKHARSRSRSRSRGRGK